MHPQINSIAYVAPELTALEATFVYEELLALEKRGLSILPVSVRKAKTLLKDHPSLLSSTIYLYQDGIFKTFLQSLYQFLTLKISRGKGLAWLISDVLEVGILSKNSWKLIYQFLVAAKLAHYLQKEKCQHLHVHFALVPAQIAMYASALTGIPFTIMAHANDIFERGILLQRKAERARKMLTISEYNCDYLRNIGVADNKLAVVRCGVSFIPHENAKTWFKKDKYRIGTLGRLVEKKGMDILIRSIYELRDKPYGIELVIAGDGPLSTELVQLVEELNQTDVVRFIGSIPHNEVQNWLRTLDIFVLACKQDSRGDMDGIPVVLMEAMSQSVSVISTQISGIPELIIDKETGLLARPGDYHELALKIDQLLNSPELRQILVSGALKLVETEFSQDVNLDRLIEHFGLLAANAPP